MTPWKVSLTMFSAAFLCKISEVCHTVIQALKCSGIFRLYCERIISQLRSTAWGEIKYSNTLLNEIKTTPSVPFQSSVVLKSLRFLSVFFCKSAVSLAPFLCKSEKYAVIEHLNILVLFDNIVYLPQFLGNMTHEHIISQLRSTASGEINRKFRILY